MTPQKHFPKCGLVSALGKSACIHGSYGSHIAAASATHRPPETICKVCNKLIPGFATNATVKITANAKTKVVMIS